MSSSTDQPDLQKKEVMSVKELAAYLGLSESKVRQLVRRDAIPYFKLDGSYRFFLPTVQEWLRQISVLPKEVAKSDEAHQIADRVWNSIGGR